MRTAAIMLAQLADPINSIRPVQQKEIRSKILKEMVSLEELRLKEVTESMSSASASLTVKPNSAVSRDSPFMEEQSISDGLEDGMIASEESAILNGSADSASQMQLTMLKEDPSGMSAIHFSLVDNSVP
jgi:hypothetical protein